MATLDDLSTALRNADAAGDADAARALAAEIVKMRSAPAPDTLTDVVKSGGVGLGKGAIGLAGLPGDIRQLASNATDYVAGKFGASQESVDKAKSLVQTGLPMVPGMGVFASGPTSKDITSKVEGYTGEFYKPQTTAGKYAQTVGEFAPGLAMGPGGLIRKAATNVLLPGVGSEAAGQATEGTKAEPYARIVGALAGGVTPSVVGRIVTPAGAASPGRQRLVEILNNEGVTSLTAGQRTGSEGLRTAESTLGNAPFTGQAANQVVRRGEEQLTDAVLRRAGAAGESAAPEVLAANSRRLGNEFEQLSARNTLNPDRQFLTDVAAARRNYDRVPQSQQRAIVDGYIDDINGHIGTTGNIPGTFYQEMRSRLSRQANGLRQSDPTLSDALRDLRNALDNAMGRSISPADREAWNAARREYGAQRVIEKTMGGASEAAGEGRIPPQALRQTVSAENRGAYARGEGQFSELARAASTIMKPVPDSGTARRSAFYNLSNLASGGIIPALAGRALMSGPVQGYLGNQVAAPMLRNLTPRQDALINALMATEQQRRLSAPQ